MRIAFDLDDTITNLSERMCNYLNETHEVDFVPQDFTNYYLKTLPIKIDIPKLFDDFFESPLFQAIRPIENSIETIKALKEKGHTLIVISARPKFLEFETKQWINRYFNNLFEEVIVTNTAFGEGPSKSEICKKQKVDVIIEDSLDSAEECLEFSPILISKPWNKHVQVNEKIRRIEDIKEIVTVL